MWQQGFVAANPVLECFGAFLEQATRDIEGSSPDARVAHGQWLADAAAFVLSVITGCVRDGWVLLSMRMGNRARNALVLLVWLGMLILCRLLWAVITFFPHGLQIAFVRASIGFGVRSHARRSAYGRTVWFSQRNNLIHHGKPNLRPRNMAGGLGPGTSCKNSTCSRSSPGLSARPCWVRLLRFTYYPERGPHDYQRLAPFNCTYVRPPAARCVLSG